MYKDVLSLIFSIFLLRSASKTKSPERPPLPARPTISAPTGVTSTRTEKDAFPVKKDIVKPKRPPPPPAGDKKNTSKPPLPPRPKSHHEVVKWWKDNEYDKNAGLDDDHKPLQWFHGKCYSICSNFLKVRFFSKIR